MSGSHLWRALMLIACSLCGTAQAGAWRSGADEVQGLPLLSRGGTAALTSAYVFWGKNWVFSDEQTTFKVNAPLDYTVTGKNQGLNFDLFARIEKQSSQQMTWDFDLNAHGASTGIIGGGISFRFDLATFGAELGEPELLPGHLGWSWGHASGARVEMRFDHAPAAVYFERGQKNEVRVFFYKDEITPGRQRYIATLSVSGDIILAPTALERYGPADYSAWPAGILDAALSPVDLSFLNAPEAPAGKRGFLAARADALVFEDGTAARFWGTNLTAAALFGTSKPNVKQQAHRLSALGFNLVRIHHHDSDWVDPNIFGDQKSRATHALDAAMLEKLDWWIKCLKDEGIYTWLDLQVGRRLLPADGITDFAEISRGGAANLTGYNYVNDSIREAMKRFDEQYLGHQNRYTVLRYKEDPAIAAILITNENDLTHHFGNALLPDKGVPKHSAIYMREARDFAVKHGLSEDKVWRAWEDGPSKIFLNDLEERFDADMIGHLRALGVRAPLVPTSSWGEDPLSSLPALTTGDLIDVHTYGGEGELERNPQLGPTFVTWMSAAHVAGKPVSVTEWGLDSHGSEAPDRADIPLYVASAASMQGLSAVLFFAYSQEPFTDSWSTPSIFHAYNDPALMASLPAAALLYRQGHVREAATTYVFTPGKDQLFSRPISPATSVALRTAAERGRLLIAMPQVPELPWLKKSPVPGGATIITDPLQSLLPAGATEAWSDSHELRRNWDEGTFTIDTPRTQAAMGWIGGKSISLPDVEIAVTTRNAVIAVQSLDGHPIGQSRSILISIGARSVIAPGNALPYYSEPVEGKLLINAAPGLGLRAWSAKSGKMRKLVAPYQNGRYVVALERSLASSWLTLDAR